MINFLYEISVNCDEDEDYAHFIISTNSPIIIAESLKIAKKYADKGMILGCIDEGTAYCSEMTDKVFEENFSMAAYYVPNDGAPYSMEYCRNGVFKRKIKIQC